MNDHRPSPESFLVKAKQETPSQKGTLKIFFGAAPGVGKTYSMLEEALRKQERGTQVLAGVVETHGREETLALLKHFEMLPKRFIEHRGKILEEFDLQKALEKKPRLILMDEMAHTNVPGSLHEKRWQDIEELIAHGIDVFTTLNVQHIESLNPTITQITGVQVQETVPDSVLEMADTIELVDLSFEDLQQRMREGKVYLGKEHTELAMHNFFQKGNLIALRELALRITAEKVNAQVLLHRKGEAIETIWATSERLLALVGPLTNSIPVIRSAHRMALRLHVPWMALFVSSPLLRLTEEEHQRGLQNIALAERLGAECITLYSSDIAKDILDLARKKNVTQILVTQEPYPRSKHLVDSLMKKSRDIDIHFVHSPLKFKEMKIKVSSPPPFPSFFIASCIFIIASLLNWALTPFVHLSTFFLVYLMAIVLIALYCGRIVSITFSVLSALALDYFFLSPQMSFVTTDLQSLITLIMMLIVSLVFSQLTVYTHKKIELYKLGEKRAMALHAMSSLLSVHRGLEKLVEVASQLISDLFNCDVAVLLPQEGVLKLVPGPDTPLELDAKELNIARWVYEKGHSAGFSTDTLSISDSLFLPLQGSTSTIGVLKIKPRDEKQLHSFDEKRLLEALSHQLALSLEVDKLHKAASQVSLELEKEKLRQALLRAYLRELPKDSELFHHLLETIYQSNEKIIPHPNKTTIKKILGNQWEGEDLPLSVDPLLIRELFDELSEFNTVGTLKAIRKEGHLFFQMDIPHKAREVEQILEALSKGETPLLTNSLSAKLNLPYAIIKAHGGKFWVEPLGEELSTLSFNLPSG